MKSHPYMLLLLCGFVSPLGDLRAEDKGPPQLITITRKMSVGARFEESFAVTQTKSMTMAQNGGPGKEQAEEVVSNLTTDTEILAVNQHGSPTKVAMTVKTFETTKAGRGRQPVPSGKKIVASNQGGKKVFAVDGQNVDQETYDLLSMMVEINDEKKDDNLDNDKIFGTKDPRKVGDEWPVDTKALMATLPADMPLEFGGEAAAGKVKFVAISKEGNETVHHLKAKITLNPTGMKGMPPQMRIDKLNVEVAYEGHLPTNLTLPALKEGMKMDMEFTGNVKGPQGEVDLTVQETRDRVITRKAL